LALASIASVLADGQPGQEVALCGWARTLRQSKTVSFVDLTDGSCLAGIQVVVDRESLGDAIAHVRTGCSLRIAGVLVESPGTKQRVELRATDVTLFGDVTDDYPLQKKRHSLEFLRTLGHLRVRTNTLSAMLRIRSQVSRAIHAFFMERGFVYLHSPIVTFTDAEGAGEMFRVTTLDPLHPPLREDGSVDFSKDFFGRRAHLTVSGQLEAEVAAMAVSKVYTFGPTFRAENSNTTRHLAEFWMVEPEVAFCELPDLRELAEAFIKGTLSRTLEWCREDLALCDERIAPGILARHEALLASAFEHIPYTECIDILSRAKEPFDHPPVWGADLQTEHERYLCEKHVGRPVVVTDYPAAIKAFYMYRNDDGRTVRAMDVLLPGVGEIIGGSQREHRLPVLEQQLEAFHLDPADYGWYLDLRRYGTVPHAGFGLGFERLLRHITGLENIRDVIPFPRVPGQAGL
jgi:asparaginyl-tRNA synthetase